MSIFGSAQDLDAEDAEAVGGVGDAPAGEEAEGRRVDARARCRGRRSGRDLAAGHPARALDVVGAGRLHRRERAEQLGRAVLVVAREEGEVRSPALEAAAPAVADRGPDAAATARGG